MKYISILIAIIIINSAPILGQTENKCKSVGFDLSGFISSSKYKDDENSTSKSNDASVSFYPMVSYFIQDGLSIGIKLNIGARRYKSSSNKEVSYQVGFAPYIRKYYALNEQWSAFGQLYAGYDYIWGNNNSGNSYDQYALNILGSVGITYFASKHWGFEASFGKIGYIYDKRKQMDPPDSKSTNTNSKISVNLSLSTASIGLQYYF